jgi:protein arginine kinase
MSDAFEPIGFKMFALSTINAVTRESLKERHLISQNLIDNAEKSGVLIDSRECSAIMVNEEDHVRAQVVLKGFELDDAYAAADRVDDLLSERVRLAFSEKYGYITSCPTNLGTGMRASVMMFLPGLTLSRDINSLPNIMASAGIVLRGVYGEGSDAAGFMYQLSNQYTLGMSEKEIIENVGKNIYSVAEAEEGARALLYARRRGELTDAAMRAWGILTNAYKIATPEFMALFAQVKLGVCLGIIKLKYPEKLDDIITAVQPASLILAERREMSGEERDVFRAEYLAKELPKLK